MPHVDVNGARLWVEEEGAGPAVLFVHGGLGDSRLWAPAAHALASRFRTIRYDLRFWGRSESSGMVFSPIDDLVGVLDALGVQRAALVGLSLGGGIALDAALAHPDRVWALVHVAAGVTGMPVNPYTDEQDAAYEAADKRGDLDAMMAIDFAVWAPLGATDEYRELWRVTPDALGMPEGATSRPRVPADLGAVSVPTLVIVPAHDPPAQREVGATVARLVPGARLVEVDSDHYLTLRERDRVTLLLEEFLRAPAGGSGLVGLRAPSAELARSNRMDDARKADFLDAVRAARVELLEIIGRSDEQTLATAKVPGMDWTPKDVLSHLIGYDLAILQATNDVHEGHPFVWPWSSSSFDAVNEDNVGVRRGRSFASVLAELETTRTSLIRELEGWSEGTGPFGVTSWDPSNSAISWLAPHEREHAEMIAKLGGFPGPRPGVD